MNIKKKEIKLSEPLGRQNVGTSWDREDISFRLGEIARTTPMSGNVLGTRPSRRNRKEETRTLRMPYLTSGFKRKSNIKSFPIVAEHVVFPDFSTLTDYVGRVEINLRFISDIRLRSISMWLLDKLIGL